MSSKVLIVEDSPTQALRARIALESRGFDVVVVSRSRDALPTAREEHPDVVLSEVRLLGLDGFELAEAFRGDDQLKAVPIVLQSGTTVDREEARSLALEHGAVCYLEKGLSPDTLATILAEAIAKTAG